MTVWTDFKRRWGNCKQCSLWKTRKRIVLARGDLPCDVLLVGEAPGASEDVLGKPFCGPAGKLLDRMVSAALSQVSVDMPLRIAYTNIVCCIPIADGKKGAEPPKAAINQCAIRLVDFIDDVAQPRRVVAVGNLAADNTEHATKIVHPASILKAEQVRRPLMIRQTVVRLRDTFENLLEEMI